MEDLSGAAAGARGLLSNLQDRFVREPRRTSLTLVLMLACAVAGAILFVAAWIGLMAALALGIVALGISLQAALTAVAFADLAVALALLWLCAHLSGSLAFPATRRQLRPKRLELV
ncbi:MAG TPA: hypothetical protein VFJ70_23330 [Burkholderiales bacterium]|nr:hypothetical protein [Burkholderiales bacterium]